jgi:hypothetical protein
VSAYSPDIVYFDLVPPLRYTGSSALRERFTDWFGRWLGLIGQEVRDPNRAHGSHLPVERTFAEGKRTADLVCSAQRCATASASSATKAPRQLRKSGAQTAHRGVDEFPQPIRRGG